MKDLEPNVYTDTFIRANTIIPTNRDDDNWYTNIHILPNPSLKSAIDILKEIERLRLKRRLQLGYTLLVSGLLLLAASGWWLYG